MRGFLISRCQAICIGCSLRRFACGMLHLSRHLQHACSADTLHMDLHCCSPLVQPLPCLAAAELIPVALAPAIVASAGPGVGLSQLLRMPLHNSIEGCRPSTCLGLCCTPLRVETQ